ncbi:MAG TPA: ABC transporter ATP-binding protein [Cytophagaceae bacterium]|jgi:ABC-type Fe3+/spermidine/putrescine transport system ATPase subunit|nr:ABC transporter ATP-binding protein [Cytophagaceae bacterium]
MVFLKDFLSCFLILKKGNRKERFSTFYKFSTLALSHVIFYVNLVIRLNTILFPFMLEIKNISKKFEGQEKSAVNDVSFSVREGEFFTLTGESGSGKSTLLRLIKGLEDPNDGEIWFDGTLVKGPSKKLIAGEEGIELAHQDYNLFPLHTVYENIQYIIRHLSDENQKLKISELLEVFRLHDYKDKIPGTLSGGQQQRVAIAKALAASPKLLLLDEPFSNLDMILRAEIKTELADYIRQTKAAVIFVTHESGDALSLSDRVAIMKEGSIVQTGSPETIYTKPANPYVASYFGNANIVKVKDLEKLNVAATKSLATNAKVCIRYEDVELAEENKAMLYAKVLRKDYFGSCFRLEVRLERLRLWMYTNASYVKKGDIIPLKINTEKVHLFE